MARFSFESEQQMYAPVSGYWQSLGYTVKGEVGHCDVVAIKEEEEPVIIEMKRHFSIALLVQAAERKQMSTRVYVAVPDPANAGKRRDFRLICQTMRIGLLLVSADDVIESVSPDGSQKAKQTKSRRRLEKEFHGRKTNANIGGSTRTKQMTAYREQAIRCAAAIYNATEGCLKAPDIRKQSGVSRASAILRDNVYGWFERLAGQMNDDGTRQLPTYRIAEKKDAEVKEWRSIYEST